MTHGDPTPSWFGFDQAPAALALVDAGHTIVRVNDALCSLLGRDGPSLVGGPVSTLLSEDDPEGSEARLAALAQDGRPYAVDRRFPHADGHHIWLRTHLGRIVGADGTVSFVAHVEDTTDHRRVTARLQRLAERDHLTGLLNRRRVEEELEEALAGIRRHDRRAALIVTDLDGFKAVNDREGHEGGDRVLSFVAATLATRVRGEDAVGRLGGDEFAVLLRDVTLEGAEAVADELVALVADGGYTRERGVTMSAGVAALTPSTLSAQDALHAADLAMYAAKTEGGDRVAVHGSEGAGHGPRSVTVVPVGGGEPERRELPAGLDAATGTPTVEHALSAVRELLGMEVSYVTRHEDGAQLLVAASGDTESFGMAQGASIPLEATYCWRVLEGTLPPVMPDVQAVPEAAVLPVTAAARIGAYASVPIRLSDGTLYGTLCAASHHPVPSLVERDHQFLAVLARLVAGELERDASLRAELALRAQAAGAEALLSAIDARDGHTGAHSRQVVELACAVAAELGLPEDEQREVAQVALLHDIGKLALPDAILTKPGPLSDDEILRVRSHPLDGERIVAGIPELAHLAPAIRAEHERWDGYGYPDGLAGEAIPVASRIVFVCDAWDAMTTDRPYRRGMPRDEALAELADMAGSQFCATSVQALFAALAKR